ncbi:Zinc finger protein [Rhynchospora pubera]|uniref:Protein EARLY HEADING DATE 2 n=1 Tax=Rhynchospora pubera TaxID=906938 RepID=A0AAV8EQ64_9POAL|nr:Zinc finger protein [Rhynchospora pubera]
MMEAGENSASVSNSNTASTEPSVSVSNCSSVAPPPKKKRNLPGMPDPDAEVIALSPKALLATNRFVCEICSKGFQRDQNLQLHRRGHNLPWKLRQRTGKEPRKRVYVCPEPSCVHHHPSRALGDLTGIKKHFCRKHGEKKWKCDKCSKRYAVHSDWKAHSKTCGTREYRCDCGTLFSRRDSFITHRAFCDALAQETAKVEERLAPTVALPPPPPPPPPACKDARSALPLQQVMPADKEEKEEEEEEAENVPNVLQCTPAASPPLPPPAPLTLTEPTSTAATASQSTSVLTSTSGPTISTTPSLFASLFTSVTPSGPTPQLTSYPDLICHVPEPPSLCLSTAPPISVFPQPSPTDRRSFTPSTPSRHMSATALLQKAAEMGATSSGTSFLKGFGLDISSPSPSEQHQDREIRESGLQHWGQQLGHETAPLLSAGLGLGLHYENSPMDLPDLMMGPSSLFVSKPTTVDFLGLGMGPTVRSPAGVFPGLIQPIRGSLDLGAGSGSAGEPFGGGSHNSSHGGRL